MAAWRIVRLNRSHNRSDFDCGQSVLNDWLKNRAGQWDKKDLARTYVAISGNETNVAGYYALSNHRVSFESLPIRQRRVQR